LKTRFILTAVLGLAAASVAAAHTARPAEPPYRITAVRAQLFYSDRGTFSGDVLAPPGKTLWNTVIGEGESGGPSNSTLVVVEVTGAPGSYEPDRSVELVATAEGKTVHRGTAQSAVLNTRGRMYAGFWLPDTGCRRIRLVARLRGQTPASETRKEIPFDCGE
jgi:hypothetical protein